MRLARSTSCSPVSSGTRPISLRYMRTGSDDEPPVSGRRRRRADDPRAGGDARGARQAARRRAGRGRRRHRGHALGSRPCLDVGGASGVEARAPRPTVGGAARARRARRDRQVDVDRSSSSMPLGARAGARRSRLGVERVSVERTAPRRSLLGERRPCAGPAGSDVARRPGPAERTCDALIHHVLVLAPVVEPALATRLRLHVGRRVRLQLLDLQLSQPIVCGTRRSHRLVGATRPRAAIERPRRPSLDQACDARRSDRRRSPRRRGAAAARPRPGSAASMRVGAASPSAVDAGARKAARW